MADLLGDDSPNGSWNPTPVLTTIEFRGMQVCSEHLLVGTLLEQHTGDVYFPRRRYDAMVVW